MYKQTVWKVVKNQYKIITWERCQLASDCQRGLTFPLDKWLTTDKLLYRVESRIYKYARFGII